MPAAKVEEKVIEEVTPAVETVEKNKVTVPEEVDETSEEENHLKTEDENAPVTEATLIVYIFLLLLWMENLQRNLKENTRRLREKLTANSIRTL